MTSLEVTMERVAEMGANRTVLTHTERVAGKQTAGINWLINVVRFTTSPCPFVCVFVIVVCVRLFVRTFCLFVCLCLSVEHAFSDLLMF